MLPDQRAIALALGVNLSCLPVLGLRSHRLIQRIYRQHCRYLAKVALACPDLNEALASRGPRPVLFWRPIAVQQRIQYGSMRQAAAAAAAPVWWLEGVARGCGGYVP